MTRNKKIGVWLFVAPILGLTVILTSYAIASFVIGFASTGSIESTATGLSSAPPYFALFATLKVILGLLGTVAVVSMFVCWPIGIYFIARKELENTQTLTQQQAQYQGLSAEQIKYLESWSWGAFFSTPVWALGNKLYWWALGSFVPLFGLYVWIKLSEGGRKMAWAKGGWSSFEQFQKRQKTMMWIIITLLVVITVTQIVGALYVRENVGGLTISN
jgi:hypothetical protein